MPAEPSAPLPTRLPALSLLLVSLLALPLALAGCQTARTRSAAVRIIPTADMLRTQAAQSRVQGIMKRAFSQVGNPYRYGGSTPETGFDCSGFVGWVYKQFGVDLPRSSRDMMAVGTPVSRSELRPGDLVFFNYGYSHVGIYTGDDRYIHSPSTGKRIQESDLNARGRGDHFVGARRIIDNNGVTAVSERMKAEWIQASRHAQAAAMSDSAARRHTGAAAYRGAARTGPRTRTAARSGGTRTAARSARASARSHKVASGDTLVAVARRYGVSVSDLTSYNGIADGNRIRPGQAIKIPPKSASSRTAKAPSASAGAKKPRKAAATAKARAGSRAKTSTRKAARR